VVQNGVKAENAIKEVWNMKLCKRGLELRLQNVAINFWQLRRHKLMS
jgi:hypothetical protein